MIPFTSREIQNAWRTNKSIAEMNSRNNAHRLLLFYSVECGLKAILMKREKIERTDYCPQIAEAGHDVNKLLDMLRVGKFLKLPKHLKMKPLKAYSTNDLEERQFSSADLYQVWRYSGRLENFQEKEKTDDEVLEKKLLEISKWIEGELER